jgi:hypothetical protein
MSFADLLPRYAIAAALVLGGGVCVLAGLLGLISDPAWRNASAQPSELLLWGSPTVLAGLWLWRRTARSVRC